MESNNLIKNNKNSAGDYSELDLTELEEFVGGKRLKKILPPWKVGGWEVKPGGPPGSTIGLTGTYKF